MTYATSSPAATSAGQGNTPPVCQNCSTSTTPLWRRDEIGSVLCNACGLFLKLHGKPRPISLKTDVIKSRNRVKSSGQSAKKKSLFDSNGLSASRSDTGTPPPAHFSHRRTSGKASSGASIRSESPVSRTGTPGAAHHLNPPAIFDGSSLSEQGFHPSPSLPSLHVRHPSPAGSASSYNADRHLEPPQSYEALVAANTTLRTRVTELEVINDLFKGHVSKLEQQSSETASQHSRSLPPLQPSASIGTPFQTQFHHATQHLPRPYQEIESRRSTEDGLRQALVESQQREDSLKRRLDALEREVNELKEAAGPRPKKMRVSDMMDSPTTDPSSS